MSAPRSAATQRARDLARRRGATSMAHGRGRSEWSTLGMLWFSGMVATYGTLMGAAIVDDASGAVVASLFACAWALVWCAMAARWDRVPAHPAMPGKARWAATRERLGFLALQLVLVSPAATHWMAGRTRGGHLDFTDTGTVQTAQIIGWVAIGLVGLGGPLAWVAARHSRARA